MIRKKIAILMVIVILLMAGCSAPAVEENTATFFFPSEEVTHEGTWLTWPHKYADKQAYSFGDAGINRLTEVDKGLGNSGVEYNHCIGAVVRRAYCTEFETVTGKGKRRGAVAVGIVDEQLWNLRHLKYLLTRLAGNLEELLARRIFQCIEQFGQLFSQE